MIEDLKYAIRGLAHRPGLTAVALLSLAIAIGPNAAIFSAVDAVLLRPAPVANADRLVWLFFRTPSGGKSFSWPDYLDLRNQSSALESVVAYENKGAMLRAGAEREAVPMNVVSENYFEALRAKPAVGRLFSIELDTRFEGVPPVVLSYSLWQRRFNGAPEIVGRTIELTGSMYRVVGIAEPNFRGINFPLPCDLWIPIGAYKVYYPGERAMLTRRDQGGFAVFGMLRPGANPQQAAAEFTPVVQRLAAEFPNLYKDARVIVSPDQREMKSTMMSLLVLSLVGLVLMIACFNVAGLLLARNEERRREIAVRLAIGASRVRLIRLLLAESVLLAAGGAAIGLLLAGWLMDLGAWIAPAFPISFHFDVRMDMRLFAYTLGISVFTALVFGLAPALRASKPDLVEELKLSEGTLLRRLPVRSVLTAAQIAVAQFLLAGAGLLLHSYLRVTGVPPGFDPSRNVLAVVALPSDPRAPARFDRVQESLAALPGVRRTVLTAGLPLSGFGVRGFQVSAGGGPQVKASAFSVEPEYFATVGTALQSGVEFDRVSARRRTVVLNQTLASTVFPQGGAVGQWLRIEGADFQVIGVAQDGKYVDLREALRPCLFLPLPERYNGEATILIETEGDPRALAGAVREAIRKASPGLWTPTVMTLGEHYARAAFIDRLAALFVCSLGLLGMFLAAVGLHGVVSHAVFRRSREFGIRLALGATRADVIRLVLRQALMLVAIGAPVGLGLSLWAARYWSSALYGVRAADPLALLASVITVAAIAILAAWRPARRATAADPGVVLRYE